MTMPQAQQFNIQNVFAALAQFQALRKRDWPHSADRFRDNAPKYGAASPLAPRPDPGKYSETIEVGTGAGGDLLSGSNQQGPAFTMGFSVSTYGVFGYGGGFGTSFNSPSTGFGRL